VKRLLAQGADPNATLEENTPILESFISGIVWPFGSDEADRDRRGLEALELVLAAGAKWNPTDRELKSRCRSLLDGRSATVSQLVELLTKYRALSDGQLHELTRTSSIQRLLGGYTKPRRDHFGSYVAPLPRLRQWFRRLRGGTGSITGRGVRCIA
jgi:hypothetical protein